VRLTITTLNIVHCLPPLYQLLQAFGAAMARIVTDPARAREMGRAGRTHTVARFSREAFARDLETVCRHLASAVARGSRSPSALLWAILAAPVVVLVALAAAAGRYRGLW
jgi:hypothetical protein